MNIVYRITILLTGLIACWATDSAQNMYYSAINNDVFSIYIPPLIPTVENPIFLMGFLRVSAGAVLTWGLHHTLRDIKLNSWEVSLIDTAVYLLLGAGLSNSFSPLIRECGCVKDYFPFFNYLCSAGDVVMSVTGSIIGIYCGWKLRQLYLKRKIASV